MSQRQSLFANVIFFCMALFTLVACMQSQDMAEDADAGQGENSNWHAQSTIIVQAYPGLPAAYSGVNSLPTRGEARETVSTDLYGGVQLWRGAEAKVDLLMWQGFGLNNTLGIEAFPNGEAYKAGTRVPRLNVARLFLRQSFVFGEQHLVSEKDLPAVTTDDSSRLTLTVGRFSLKDIFDNNAYANDPRTQFMNWGLMANVAWDYPSDALGYTTGAAVEVNRPQLVLRYGFFQIDRLRNAWTAEDDLLTWPHYSGAGDGPFFRAWGMVGELERPFKLNTHPGTVRVLAYLNQGMLGNYQAALSVPGADISVTRAYRHKYGIGLNAEQEITKDVGVFSRLGWNDGHTEAWMFTDINYSASFGFRVKGTAWHHSSDTLGLGAVMSGISHVNREFLAAGGTGILDGDGALNYAGEKVLEAYYDHKFSKQIHGALDCQFIDDPAFNHSRGPVSVFGTRVHWEF